MKDVHAKLEKVEGKVEAKCEICSDRGVATAFCRQCVEFICDKCIESHQRLKIFSGHKISTIEELKQGGAREIVAELPPPPTCKVHEEQAKIYCYDCKSLICRDCVVKDHKEHEYEFVKKAAPQTKKKLTEELVPLNQIQARVRSAARNVEEKKAEVGTMGECMTSSIKRSFQELRNVIDKREKELLIETSTIVEEKTKKLTIQGKKLEMCSCTIQSVVELVERNIENATDGELMSIHTQLLSRVREETEKQRQTAADLEPVEKADRVVVVECADGVKKECQDNASIIALPLNISMENTEAVVGQRSHLVVRFTTQGGQPFKKLESAKVILTSKVDGSHVDTKTISRGQNCCEVEFTPTVRGRHQLEVVYNDAPLLRGPVEIFVKIPPDQLGKPIRSIDMGKSTKFITLTSSEEFLVTAGDEIIAFDKSGKKLYSIANEALKFLNGIAIDGTNLYVADGENNCVLKFDKSGKLLKSVGREGSGEGEFNGPLGLTVAGSQVFVCDFRNRRVQVLTSDLVFVRQIGSEGSSQGQFSFPFDITHDEEGNLYVTDFGNGRVKVFNTQGKFRRFLVPSGPGGISNTGISIRRDLVYISQSQNRNLFLYQKDGRKVGSFICDGCGPKILGIAVDKDGFIYVCDNTDKVTIY